MYETLLWYNGTTSDRVVSWLAKEYTISPDGRSIQFTLRDGIRFADGNALNSTAVYFSLNRLVFLGVKGSFLCCDFQFNYTQSPVERLLTQNLVRVTGPLTFELNVPHPDGELIYRLAVPYAAIIDPQFVMSRDLALWTGPNSIPFLPYTTFSGSLMERITQYLKDEAYACSKTHRSGCQTGYLSTSNDGSLAGTGPYMIRDVSADLTHVVLSARSDYWGGPDQFTGGKKIVPHFGTVYVNRVPLESDRLQDLRNGAATGAPMSVDVNNDQLYALADRTTWLGGGKLLSVIQGVSLYGPYTIPMAQADTINFVMNVSDASTGKFYQFQPFADLRLRLAFADSVDIGRINREYNDNLGQVAQNTVFPGSAPPGAYNSSILPSYSFNPMRVQALLIDAMEHPLTSFRFFNGTVAPPGLFNNTFGCRGLNAQNRCDNPVPRTITLAYRVNDTLQGRPTINGEVIRRMATAISNVSDTYHMGLRVAAEALSVEKMFHQGLGGNLFMWEYHGGDDTPWVVSQVSSFAQGLTPLSPLTLSQGFCDIDQPSCINVSDDGLNSTETNLLYERLVTASSEYNFSAVVSLSNQLMDLENRHVSHVWTVYPIFLAAVTSNVQGFYYNPSLWGMYFAPLDLVQPPDRSLAAVLLTNGPLLLTLTVAGTFALIGAFAVRSSRRKDVAVGVSLPPIQGGPEKVVLEGEKPNPRPKVQLAMSFADDAEAGRALPVKLDLVNTGGGLAILHKVEGLLASGLVLEEPARGSGGSTPENPLPDGSLLMRGRRLRPGEIQSIRYAVRAQKEGEFEIAPKVSYSDEKGALLTDTFPATRLTVRPSVEFEFKTSRAEILFDFLVSAFIQDYMERRYAEDKAGWRSLGDISQMTKIPIQTLYGREGGVGPDLGELSERGLIETRIFPGERGRGGKVMRVRAAYERDAVREIVSRRVRNKR